MITAGNLPTVSRWVREGTHRLVEWHTGIPSTTPASQAGILHGGAQHIPAFRWYEKDAGRLVVTNRPGDAAYVEAILSDGDGLLSGGGASISNVFSGDAESSVLTFSTVSRHNQTSRGSATFLVSPNGFSRALVLTVGEMIKELYQARRAAPARRSPADFQRWFVRRTQSSDERPAPGAEHRAHRRADGPRCAGHLLRLRRLRRGCPPCRTDPARIARRAAGTRPGHRALGTAGPGRRQPLPDRGALRSWSKPRRDFQAALRRDAWKTSRDHSCRVRSHRPRMPRQPRSGARSTRC